LADVRGVYRTLWTHGVPADVVTPSMDWSGYRLLFLPNVTLMTDEVRERIERTLEHCPDTRLVAEGSFGIYQGDGQSSYGPPEGLADRLGVRVADFSAVTDYDIEQGRNVLQTPHGAHSITSPCGYAVLEPLGDTRTIATLDGAGVAVKSADGRFTWYGLTLSAGFDDVGQPEVVQGLLDESGIEAPVAVEGDLVVPVVRRSRQGGWLVFVFNLERSAAQVQLRPGWMIASARDLLAQADLAVEENAFHLSIDQWEVAVVHCPAV
ncbi:MAG: beta-galactosidase trimerization domain-containing protein, partial [Chloroflexi bacterium]|nr:beta-galactosidase trimerization domain-containing protein [Chloroflexota bacterium]